MHIVIMAWLFIVFAMALTMRAWQGIALFLAVGMLPVALYAWLAARRRRAARDRAAATRAR